MSASLVGSEMCIRDRALLGTPNEALVVSISASTCPNRCPTSQAAPRRGPAVEPERPQSGGPDAR
eukprot:8993933-Alexandrium_andersonii.AAC.1